MTRLEERDTLAEEREPAVEEPSEQQTPGRLLAGLLKPKWLLVLLAVSVAGHAIGFTYSRLVARRPA